MPLIQFVVSFGFFKICNAIKDIKMTQILKLKLFKIIIADKQQLFLKSYFFRPCPSIHSILTTCRALSAFSIKSSEDPITARPHCRRPKDTK